MSKLKSVQGSILFSGNDLPVVVLTEHEDGREELTVFLPEGVHLHVLPADSGLKIVSFDAKNHMTLNARRVAPPPVLGEEKKA
jgi:hypothetical protein